MAIATTHAPRTLVDRIWVRPKSGVEQMVLVVAGSLFMALLSQIIIRIPWITPVPITGQTLGVLVVGGTLGSRLGGLSMVLYMAEGLVGLPFFAGGASGWNLGPSGGYLFGFILAAFIIGRFADRGWDRRFSRALWAMVVAELAVFACGVTWLHVFYMSWSKAIALGFFPFVIGDALKSMLAGLMFPSAWRLLGGGR